MSKRWPDKLVIGLTGNIASGKSVVRRMLEYLGAFGIDADGLAHRAMSPNAPAYRPVVEAFGRWILRADGQIDRARLGRVVFSDPEALRILEQITHPIVREVIGLLVRRARQRVVVIEAIKLIEDGLANDCDAVWVVDAPVEVRVERLMRDRQMSESEARMRIGAQGPQPEKLARATTVIDNSDGYEDTYRQVRHAFNALLGIEEPALPPQPEAVAAGELVIRRGSPSEAANIAAFLNRMQGSTLARADVLHRFGQKAYMLSYVDQQIVGLIGWQVENLIARVDELVFAPGAPIEQAVPALIEAVESSANDLQSEIALVFLPDSALPQVRQLMLASGYEERTPADLRVPDWREAAEESAPPGATMVFKRLRADRVLKPI